AQAYYRSIGAEAGCEVDVGGCIYAALMTQVSDVFPRPASGRATAQPLARLLAELQSAHRARVTGLRGGARGHVLAHLVRGGLGPLLALAPDEEAADLL